MSKLFFLSSIFLLLCLFWVLHLTRLKCRQTQTWMRYIFKIINNKGLFKSNAISARQSLRHLCHWLKWLMYLHTDIVYSLLFALILCKSFLWKEASVPFTESAFSGHPQWRRKHFVRISICLTWRGEPHGGGLTVLTCHQTV